MFTGIITDKGEITAIDKSGDWKIRIACGLDMDTMPIGASIACSGVCLTVIEKDSSGFLVQVSQETLDKTAIGDWYAGKKINLESSLKMGDELGGHLVFGHVDGLAELVSVTPVMDSHAMVFALPDHLEHLAAAKGSIALDGVSLTVNAIEGRHIHINIIPHTWQVTGFSELRAGEKVHVEADMLARYVSRILEVKNR